MLTYSKSLLTGINANSTFRTVLDFKKLKTRQHAVEIFIIFCYDYKHLPFSSKPYQPQMNVMENKYQTF